MAPRRPALRRSDRRQLPAPSASAGRHRGGRRRRRAHLRDIRGRKRGLWPAPQPGFPPARGRAARSCARNAGGGRI